jgi:hypothetical protein
VAAEVAVERMMLVGIAGPFQEAVLVVDMVLSVLMVELILPELKMVHLEVPIAVAQVEMVVMMVIMVQVVVVVVVVLMEIPT